MSASALFGGRAVVAFLLAEPYLVEILSDCMHVLLVHTQIIHHVFTCVPEHEIVVAVARTGR